MKWYKNTVSDELWEALQLLAKMVFIKDFRLVGGTALSLQLGHRISVDIDLFTDQEYESVDFLAIEKELKKSFKTVDGGLSDLIGLGKSSFIGQTNNELIKLDMYYTDKFVFASKKMDQIQISSIKEIAAMKLETIGNSGRKKDYWDIHELLERFSLDDLLSFYKKRYPFGKTEEEITDQLLNSSNADNDFDPICLRNKYWDLIKFDLEAVVQKYKT